MSNPFDKGKRKRGGERKVPGKEGRREGGKEGRREGGKGVTYSVDSERVHQYLPTPTNMRAQCKSVIERAGGYTKQLGYLLHLRLVWDIHSYTLQDKW